MNADTGVRAAVMGKTELQSQCSEDLEKGGLYSEVRKEGPVGKGKGGPGSRQYVPGKSKAGGTGWKRHWGERSCDILVTG